MKKFILNFLGGLLATFFILTIIDHFQFPRFYEDFQRIEDNFILSLIVAAIMAVIFIILGRIEKL